MTNPDSAGKELKIQRHNLEDILKIIGSSIYMVQRLEDELEANGIKLKYTTHKDLLDELQLYEVAVDSEYRKLKALLA